MKNEIKVKENRIVELEAQVQELTANHENEVKRFERIITKFIMMNGIIIALWFISNWIATIFLK